MAAYVNLGSLSVGAVVSLRETSGYENYIVAKHNYATSGGRALTLLVRRNVVNGTGSWDSSIFPSANYEGTTIDKFMQNYMDRISGTIDSYIPSVNISCQKSYLDTSVVFTLSRKIFALSGTELNFSHTPPEGSAIPYFSTRENRIAKDINGLVGAAYWTRTLGTVGGSVADAGLAWTVNAAGTQGNDGQLTGRQHYRPALCLAENQTVQVSGISNTILSNVSPGAPSSVTVNGGSSITSDVPFTVSWGAASDSDGNLSYYTVLRSTDGGKTWSQRARVASAQRSITDTIGYKVATSVMYGVYAEDEYIEGPQRNSSSVQVINNTAPGAPANIYTTPSPPLRGESVTVTWPASTDADGNLSKYVLQRQADGGTWMQVYSGSGRTFTETAGTWNTVMYRVSAVDTYNAQSAWKTSSLLSLGDPVTITITPAPDSDFQDGADYATDKDRLIAFDVSNNLDPDMQESYGFQLTLDGAPLEEGQGMLAFGRYAFQLPKAVWQQILNGAHQLTFAVTNKDGASSTKTVTFHKAVYEAILQSEPIFVDVDSGNVIKKFLLNLQGQFPQGSSVIVKVTNNAMDETPVWQTLLPGEINASDFVTIGNDVVQNGNYFALRLEAQRGAADEDCWIHLIEGIAGMSYVYLLGGDTAQLQADLVKEKQERVEGDNTLGEALESGFSDANAAILAEKQERVDADQALSNRIDEIDLSPGQPNNINMRGLYDDSAIYVKGDVVTYAEFSSLYYCMAEEPGISGTPPGAELGDENWALFSFQMIAGGEAAAVYGGRWSTENQSMVSMPNAILNLAGEMPSHGISYESYGIGIPLSGVYLVSYAVKVKLAPGRVATFDARVVAGIDIDGVVIPGGEASCSNSGGTESIYALASCTTIAQLSEGDYVQIRAMGASDNIIEANDAKMTIVKLG